MRKTKRNEAKKKYIKYGLPALLILGICFGIIVLLRRRKSKETLKEETSEGEIPDEERTEEKAPEQKAPEEADQKAAENRSKTSEPEIRIHQSRQKKGIKKAGKAGYVLYFMLVFGICIVPLLLLYIRPAEAAAAENRVMASWPEIWTQEGFNWSYLSEAGTYFTDHFGLRQELVTVNARVRSEVFGVSPEDDVISGKNGWLYYTATLDDYQHKNNVSERMLFNMAHNMALMQEYSEGLGKTFVFTIAPNKNTLYDENMPERLRFQVNEKSDAERLLPWLVRENINYADLFDLFDGQEEVLYYARDSHWNEKGAVMVYNALLETCGKPHETYEEAKPLQKTDYLGDLGRMLYPAGGEPESRLCYPVRDTWYYVEGDNVEDQFIRTENEEGEGNLLMYRDSFGNSLLPYMAQAFSQAAFSRQVPYPMSDLVTCEPDIVIVEKVERHLPTLGMVPPLMSAPLRIRDGTRVSVTDSAATVWLTKEGSYWKLEGMADPAYMDTDSRIYVEVDDGSGPGLYEAFCVSRTDKESGAVNDHGYMLYISEILITGDTFHVRVMTEQEENLEILLEKEIQG